MAELKKQIETDPVNWAIYLMDFVDDFRYYRDQSAIREPFALDNPRVDALLASTTEYLCDEAGIAPPAWMEQVPACRTPYFVSGIESLKSFTLVQSPARFRIRKIFVLENFLNRV
ncbi:MAG: hypothetical protein H0T45_19035 [Pyrinomonadaceae bacterium]|nr:hypothetical protein [Pyrinomonadaceae bacterium]